MRVSMSLYQDQSSVHIVEGMFALHSLISSLFVGMVVSVAALMFLSGSGAAVISSLGNLTCYDCSETNKNFWDPFTPCQSNLTNIPLIRCHDKDRYCRVERTTVKGMTISINRGCAEDCYYGCRVYGYGISQLRCTSCCRGYGCNTDNTANAPTFDLATLLTVICAVYQIWR